MILATSFTSQEWLTRLIKKRSLEGLHTTRPWGIIQIVDDEAPDLELFKEDMLLVIKQTELPDLSTPHDKNFDELSSKITNMTNTMYSNPCPYWLIITCNSGKNKSAAISKWVSDNYLVPIKTLYTGHDISTSNISRKLYYSIDSKKVQTSNFSFGF